MALTQVGMGIVGLAFTASTAVADSHVVTAGPDHKGFSITSECIERILREEVPDASYFSVVDDLSGNEAHYSIAQSDLRSVYIAAANDQLFTLGYIEHTAEGEPGEYIARYDTEGGKYEWRALTDENPMAATDARAIAEEGAARVREKAESCMQPMLLG